MARSEKVLLTVLSLVRPVSCGVAAPNAVDVVHAARTGAIRVRLDGPPVASQFDCCFGSPLTISSRVARK